MKIIITCRPVVIHQVYVSIMLQCSGQFCKDVSQVHSRWMACHRPTCASVEWLYKETSMPCSLATLLNGAFQIQVPSPVAPRHIPLQSLYWSMLSEWAHYWPENGCKNTTVSASLCSFELNYVEQTKLPHCDVKGQWWLYVVRAQCPPRANWSDIDFSLSLWIQLAWQSSLSRHRIV